MKKWQEAANFVLSFINKNKLVGEDSLPSDQTFAAMLGCSVQPVARAMDNLASRGLVRRGSGSPTKVVGQAPLTDDHEFSFSHSAKAHDHAVSARLLEVSRRTPTPGREVEVRAQKVLGLRRKEPFYAVARLRLLDGEPRVLHRIYLNPAHFPPTALTDHDFASGSLIDLYNTCGYRVDGRETTLRARLPTPEEAVLLKCEGEPVLEAEQRTDAVRAGSGEVVPLEYLLATYVRWEYRIRNRRPPAGGGPS